MSPLILAEDGSHFDHRVGARVHQVLPGDHLVIADPDAAVCTLLGSCVAACIRDTTTGVGGLNHFLLPGSDQSQSARYGAFAMEVLINEILGQGGRRERLEAKIFGAAESISGSHSRSVGSKNAAFARHYLETEGIPVVAADLGGTSGRRIYYFPSTGMVRVQYLAALESRAAEAQEARYRKTLGSAPVAGAVELFG
ncbi:chemoreceptor glutamine deamidase CheD [Oceanibium sediminis]|uniref:chemoreceptor glutamine deamidase CheD n=1 Tax=Oceanibium sediminis TaxID=2026339 RepID=UPI000DD3ECA4|nr:chemoreceptor glutamine deamidase CheD [Oceanibium sediminis]